jgi:hypothetical protein
MVLQSGGFKTKERCCKLPLSTGTKTDEPWRQIGYSSWFPIATWKVGVGPTIGNNKG